MFICYDFTTGHSVIACSLLWNSLPGYVPVHGMERDCGNTAASTLFNARALQSFSTISVQVFFGLPPGLAPSTSYSTHFFTQSLSSFHSTCPYLRSLFCCSTVIMSSNPTLSLNSLLVLLILFQSWILCLPSVL